MLKKIRWHLLFWFLYFGLTMYNALYLSESFSLHPSWQLFIEALLSESILLSVKITVVYLTLYALIPSWIKNSNKLLPLLQGILLMFAGALTIRLLVHVVIWPYIYQSTVNLNTSRLVARYFYSLLDVLQIVGIAATIKLYKLRMQAIRNERILEQEKLVAEISHLKSQINPHFLFNSLNSIYSLALTKSELGADAIMKLSNILRYMLYETEAKTVPLNKEINLLEDYIGLQKLRFGNRITIHFSCNNPNPSEQIAPLLLLPLLENAFKHSNDLAAEITFELNVAQHQLQVCIKNPIVEGSVKHDTQGGIGLKNIERQLELLYRKHHITYTKHNGIFILTLSIDLNSYAANDLFDT